MPVDEVSQCTADPSASPFRNHCDQPRRDFDEDDDCGHAGDSVSQGSEQRCESARVSRINKAGVEARDGARDGTAWGAPGDTPLKFALAEVEEAERIGKLRLQIENMETEMRDIDTHVMNVEGKNCVRFRFKSSIAAANCNSDTRWVTGEGRGRREIWA